jgi:4-hydroxy-tetrahydrodipicolinate synthase
MHEGIWTAICTPFQQGKPDWASLVKLVEHQVAGGVTGIIPCGTTGESATLNREEKLEVIARTVAAAKGRVKVMAGTGGNATAETAAFTRDASALGVDAVLVVTPAYNKPQQKGLVLHYKEVAAATTLPVMLYNVPGRTACNMLPDTVAQIAAACPNVVSVKEASGDIGQMARVRMAAPNVELLCGDDGLFLPSLAIGSLGVVSVVSNVAPKLPVALMAAYRKGDHATAQRLHGLMLTMADALFAESNPVPAKYALSKMGIGDGSVRLPLAPLGDDTMAKVEKAVAAAKSAGMA